MWESAIRTTKTLTNELETTFSQIEHDDKKDKSKVFIVCLVLVYFMCTDNSRLNLFFCLHSIVTTKVAPWIQRASDIKAEVVVNHELEHKLQQHNEEIIKLIKDVRLKVSLLLLLTQFKIADKNRLFHVGSSTSRIRCQGQSFRKTHGNCQKRSRTHQITRRSS